VIIKSGEGGRMAFLGVIRVHHLTVVATLLLATLLQATGEDRATILLVSNKCQIIGRV